MKKRIFALFLSVAMVFVLLTGCGNGTSGATSGAASGSSAAGSAAASSVTANPNYPDSGTISCTIGWSAGGTTDLISRKIASIMSTDLNCNNNCTNVTGASGSIAGAQVQSEGGNGETAFGGMLSAIGTWRAMGYNDEDWSNWYCFIAAQADYVLCVSKKSDFNNYQDFIDYAKANPNKLNAGNPGLGSVAHLAAVTMCNAMGITTNHVPYSGGRAAAIGVMGGEIDYVFVAYGDVYDLIQSGDLKPLAWTGSGDKTVTKSDGSTVTIPSIADQYPDVGKTIDLLGMWGVALPRTIDDAQLAAFEQEWTKAVQSDEYKNFCDETGIKPVCIYGADSDTTMAKSQTTYVELLKSLNLTKQDSPTTDPSAVAGWPQA
jgi:tripartite-type tricarboxylate transporter receptor subunit TctC